MSLEEINRIFFNFKPLLRVLFSGGEPFLRNDIVSIVKIIYKHLNPLHISIPTNGILTNQIVKSLEQILPYCKDTVINISISLNELYQRRDEIMGVEGSFDKSMDTYFQLQKLKKRFSNLILGVIITQIYSNQKYLDKIYDFAKDIIKVDNISFGLIRNSWRKEEEANIDINIYEKTCEKIKRDSYDIYGKRLFPFWRFFVEQKNLVNNYVMEIYKKNKFFFPCYSGRIRIVITPDGEVYPCEILMLKDRKKFKMGDLRNSNYSIKEIYRSEKYYSIIQYIKKNKCFCRHECDLTTTIFFNPKLFLTLLLKLVKGMKLNKYL